MRFALLGAAGYVAPKHMRAIRDTGQELVLACDLANSVGVLDSFFPDAAFVQSIEEFDGFLDSQARAGNRIHWVSVCTPNDLHVHHARMALFRGANVICEKPAALSESDLNLLREYEQDSGQQISVVMQSRFNPLLQDIQKIMETGFHDVRLTYIAPRGPWYQQSWKGSTHRSGGVIFNIGIHFLDLLVWLFGDWYTAEVFYRDDFRIGGLLRFARADVQWFLSTDRSDLPQGNNSSGFRELEIDGTL